ncbi:MAG: ABC transporter, ATP-binding protein (cluster 5, nickel/peptides/opines) / ABC transporter, ATP-binding protein (cluster 5, nickel/peptides/opines), partial [uncultured Thermoleophilia bacterium]
AQDVPAGGRRRARPDGHQPRAEAGRDARPGRGVGQRQDDLRPRPARPQRARRRRHARARRPAARGLDPAARPRPGARHPDRLPEPRRRPEPSLLGARDHRSCRRQAARHGRQGGGAARPGHRLRCAVDAAAPRRQAPAALRWPEAARGDRAGLRGRAADGGLRRADVRARRVGPGGDPEPARRPAAGPVDRVPVHLPRPRRGALPRRPDRRALPRARARARRRRDGVQRAAPSVHRGAALGGPHPRRDGQEADPARGRDPERGQPADGLRVPLPLPAPEERPLRDGAAAARGEGARPLHAVSLDDRRAAGDAAHRTRGSAGRPGHL